MTNLDLLLFVLGYAGGVGLACLVVAWWTR
jgi:hypothetical protein